MVEGQAVVDRAVVFMHNVGATQELANRSDAMWKQASYHVDDTFPEETGIQCLRNGESLDRNMPLNANDMTYSTKSKEKCCTEVVIGVGAERSRSRIAKQRLISTVLSDQQGMTLQFLAE